MPATLCRPHLWALYDVLILAVCREFHYPGIVAVGRRQYSAATHLPLRDSRVDGRADCFLLFARYAADALTCDVGGVDGCVGEVCDLVVGWVTDTGTVSCLVACAESYMSWTYDGSVNWCSKPRVNFLMLSKVSKFQAKVVLPQSS